MRIRPQPSGSGAAHRGSPACGGGSGWVLFALILAAAVATLNLAVPNVALPAIGKTFDTGQTQLNLVAVGFSLGR